MCDNSYLQLSLRNNYRPPHKSWSVCVNAKAKDSSFMPSEEIEEIDENYLSTRWSHTAKFLREFTERKAAQAEEIRRQRASLQVLPTKDRPATLNTSISPQSSEGNLGRNMLGSEEVSLPAVGDMKLPQSTARGSSFAQPSQSATGVPSTTSLDVLLQSVLQRSTAVSTKLTKTYAQSAEVEEPIPEPPPRYSHTSMRKTATHIRGDRGRSQSRVQRQNTMHYEEGGRREPSPQQQPQQQSQQQQQQQQHPPRPQGSSTMASPVMSRSSSPSSMLRGESTLGSLPQIPSSMSQPDIPALGKELQFESQDLQQQQQSSLTSQAGAIYQEQQQQPQMGAVPGEQNQHHALHKALSRQKRTSSGGLKSNNAAARRELLNRRVLSQSMDSGMAPLRRRSDGPFPTEGDGAEGGRTAVAAGPGGHSRRRTSGGGVHLPHLGRIGSRSARAIRAGERRGAYFSGGPKSLDRPGSSSSHCSSGETSSHEAMRRPLGNCSWRPDQGGVRRSGSLSPGFLYPNSQSPWAKSTTARELVFTQF